MDGTSGYLVLAPNRDIWGDLAGRLSLNERSVLMAKSRGSRLGASGWKTAFLRLFPMWAQEAYWELIDAQRKSAVVASRARKALQINLPKPAGGFRPITLLEESLKSIEGPVARRRVQARAKLGDQGIYSRCNLAGETGKLAACEVLYTDTLGLRRRYNT